MCDRVGIIRDGRLVALENIGDTPGERAGKSSGCDAHASNRQPEELLFDGALEQHPRPGRILPVGRHRELRRPRGRTRPLLDSRFGSTGDIIEDVFMEFYQGNSWRGKSKRGANERDVRDNQLLDGTQVSVRGTLLLSKSHSSPSSSSPSRCSRRFSSRASTSTPTSRTYRRKRGAPTIGDVEEHHDHRRLPRLGKFYHIAWLLGLGIFLAYAGASSVAKETRRTARSTWCSLIRSREPASSSGSTSRSSRACSPSTRSPSSRCT